MVQRPLIILFAINVAFPLLKLAIELTQNGTPSTTNQWGNFFGLGKASPLLILLMFTTYELITLILDFVALAWMSARFGLRSRSPVLAFALCLGLLFVPRWLMFCVPSALIAAILLELNRKVVSGNVRRWMSGESQSTVTSPVPPTLPLPSTPPGS